MGKLVMKPVHSYMSLSADEQIEFAFISLMLTLFACGFSSFCYMTWSTLSVWL